MTTLVIQSHRSPLPFDWLTLCIESVKQWSAYAGFSYRFVGDELFATLPDDIRQRPDISPVIKSDLARLRLIQQELNDYECVVWLDADVLIVDQQRFQLPEGIVAVGRENWPQFDNDRRLKNYRKVHNAAMMFRRGNSLLSFYADTAERFLRDNNANIPPQFIGPKLLTALHNVAQLPVWESAGMMSPMVALDILGEGDGSALAMLKRKQSEPLRAINLCSSSIVREDLNNQQMMAIIHKLLQQQEV